MNLITRPPRSNSLGIKRITREHLSSVQRPTLITFGKNSLTISSPPRIELKRNFEDISTNSTLFYGNRSLDIFFIFPSLSGSFHYFFDTFIYIYIQGTISSFPSFFPFSPFPLFWNESIRSVPLEIRRWMLCNRIFGTKIFETFELKNPFSTSFHRRERYFSRRYYLAIPHCVERRIVFRFSRRKFIFC